MRPWFLMWTLLCATSAWAAEGLPSGGTPFFPGDSLDSFALSGSEMEIGHAEVVPVEGRTFQRAFRLATTGKAKNPWSVQVSAMSPLDVRMGDVLYAEFWIRSVAGGAESAEGYTIFVFEKFGEPWTKSAEVNVAAGREWKKITLPFTAALSTPAKGAQFCLRMGFAPQTIEIGGMQLLSYGKKAKKEDFPKMEITYDGREKDAAWRQEARDRIERVRKADLKVAVIDKAGRPVPNARVQLKMLRHRFAWGTAVQAQRLAGIGMDVDQYQEEIPKWFNEVVFENDLKWPFWEAGAAGNDSSWNPKWVDSALNRLREDHLTVRGHNMVWPSWRNLPPRLKDLANDKEKLREEVRKHVLRIGKLYRGRLGDWDVVNEPYTEHDLTDLLGMDFLVDCFKWAREADPHGKLYLNEYGIFSGGGLDAAHQDSFFKTLTFLKEKGAPVDGLGIQSHLGTTLTPPTRLLSLLDRFGTLGLAVKITELDFQIDDPKTEYDYFRDYLTAVYSHPSVAGILMWGFWDGAHWQSKAPLFTKEWTLKPAGKAYQELVLGEWWTNGEGKTGADGAFIFRGTQGDYEVKVEGKGGKAVQSLSILPEGGTAAVTLR